MQPSIAALRTRGVTHVTVNCAFVGDACKRSVIRRSIARPEFALVRIAHWRGQGRCGCTSW